MPRKSKSENGEVTPSTTFKLGDMHRFLLHLIARQNDQTYTHVLEEAIDELAQTKINLGASPRVLFDVEPSVRMLNIFARPKYKPSREEAELVALVRAHPKFWYSDDEQTVPRRDFAVILWSNRKRYLQLWRKREKDYWATAEAMAADLKKARPDLKLPKFGDK